MQICPKCGRTMNRSGTKAVETENLDREVYRRYRCNWHDDPVFVYTVEFEVEFTEEVSKVWSSR